MADKWTDERDRDWRDRDWQRAERFGRGRSRDERDADRSSEGRSFDPRSDDYSFADLGYGQGEGPQDRGDYGARRSGSDRDEVFGERQTGDDYSGAGYGGQRSPRGYGGQGYGARGQAYRGRSSSGAGARQDRSDDDYGRDQRYGDRGSSERGYTGRGYGGPAGAFGGERRWSDDDDRYESPHDYGFEPPEYGSVPMTYDSPRWRGGNPVNQGRGPDRREHHVPNVREGRGEGGRGWWDRAKTSVAAMFGDEEAERRHQWDRQMQGEHRGRGPKGYTRSDERISDDVHQRLTDDPWVDASDIEVLVAAGEVTLTGTVSDRDEKRRAERCIEDVSGVHHVQNNLRIRYGAEKPLSGGDRNPLTSSDAGAISADSATSGNLNLGGGRGAGAPAPIPGADTTKKN